jgi:hypothetical protein
MPKTATAVTGAVIAWLACSILYSLAGDKSFTGALLGFLPVLLLMAILLVWLGRRGDRKNQKTQ